MTKKFDRVLSDEWLPLEFKSGNDVPVTSLMVNLKTLKSIVEQAEQAVLAKLAEQQKPVMYARTYYGEIDWDEVCVTEKNDGSLIHATDMRKEEFTRHGFAVIPLYAYPCVSPTSDKTTCVSEKAESETQTSGQGIFDSSNHIPDTDKMVIPEGYALVPVEPTDEMIGKIAVTDNYIKEAFRSFYKSMLAAAPKYKD